MTTARLPFDQPHTERISRARAACLSQIITVCRAALPLSTALDAGTGTGYFAAHLSRQHNLQVTAFDVRPSNVQEAQPRHPNVKFAVGNIEDADILQLGQFDLVIAFGLLYHLENPFRAVRHLAQMTRKLLVVESMIAPGRLPQALLLDEYLGDDQAVRYVAFHLTESGVIKLLYRAEIPYVYLSRINVAHEAFHGRLFHRRVRTVVVASREPLDSAFFTLVPEPYNKLDRPYYYRSPLRWALKPLFAFARGLKGAR